MFDTLLSLVLCIKDINFVFYAFELLELQQGQFRQGTFISNWVLA